MVGIDPSGGRLAIVAVRRGVAGASLAVPPLRHDPRAAKEPARFEEIDRLRAVVFYCQSGARSAQASAFLSGKGWQEVYNLAGGMNAWVGKGMLVAAPG